jgi:glycosyltransferase
MISLFILKPNNRGMQYGLGTYLKQLTGALLLNEDINIYIINYSSDSYKEFSISSTIHRITEIHIPPPVIKIRDEKLGQRYSARIIDLLTPFIEKSPHPVIQVNYPDAVSIAKHFKSRFSIPVISVIHSAQWQFAYDGNKHKFKKLWLNGGEKDRTIIKSMRIEKELYEISDKIVSVTRYMKDFLIDYYKIPEEKITVIPNGIDRDFKLIGQVEKVSLKQNLGFNRDEKIILLSGRLDRGKGLFFLIDAFTEVCKQYDNVRLLLVGDDIGPDKISQYLTHCKNIWAKVTFTGFVDQETMMKFYQIADVGIIPSIYDHCPYVALEMICHNVPIIISNTEGLNEILTDKQSVYLTPHYDNEGNIVFNKKEISGAILSLVNYSEKAKRLTKDYPELIQTRFSGQRMGRAMYLILKESLSKTIVES